MSKVYLCWIGTFDGAGCYYSLEEIFDDEIKAIYWKDEEEDTNEEWREYEERKVTCV
tara:strand:- start:2478 stop:2648 length:171 start_codon:yes stop_codon:yes gene_type:complete